MIMRILILAESLEINKTSSGIVSSNFIKAVTFIGEVTVLYPDRYALNQFNPKAVWIGDVELKCFHWSSERLYEKLINSVPKVRALPTYATGMQLAFRRLISDWEKHIEKALAEEDYDLMIVLGTGMSFAPHFAMANLNPDIPWIANIHDPFPGHFYPPPYNKKENMMYRNVAKKFNIVLEKATWITFPSLRLQEWMERFYPVISQKSFVVPHIMPTEALIETLPHNTEEDRAVILKKGKFNLLHAGSLLGPRDPHYLIKAFLRFIEEDPLRKENAVLNIIGKVAREHCGFEEAYNALKENINIITKRVSYKHSLALLKQTDVLVLLEAVSDTSPFMPGKLADYIWADKPILALTPKVSETARILGKNYPYITETDNDEAIYNLLVQLWEKWLNDDLYLPHSVSLKEYVSSERNCHKIIEEIQCTPSQR